MVHLYIVLANQHIFIFVSEDGLFADMIKFNINILVQFQSHSTVIHYFQNFLLAERYGLLFVAIEFVLQIPLKILVKYLLWGVGRA